MKRTLAVLLFTLMLAPWVSAAQVEIGGMPDYDWWYGCTPTSVGMILGYYDRNGYGNLIPGGTAPLNTFGQAPSFIEDAIASSGHINDFYNNGGSRGGPPNYGVSGDDGDAGYVRDYSSTETLIGNAYDSPTAFDSIADYLGTNQDGTHAWKVHGNSNGSTSFINLIGGDSASQWTASDYISATDGTNSWGDVGLPGILEYITKRGYSVDTLYHQAIDERVSGAGFTFANFQTEIDNNRPVLVSIDGHSMVGYGYDDGTSEIFVRDTWAAGGAYNGGKMTWNGTYNGAAMQSMVVIDLGGPGAGTPEPGSLIILLLGLGGMHLVRFRRQRAAA